jgi:hypothetical protein
VTFHRTDVKFYVSMIGCREQSAVFEESEHQSIEGPRLLQVAGVAGAMKNSLLPARYTQAPSDHPVKASFGIDVERSLPRDLQKFKKCGCHDCANRVATSVLAPVLQQPSQ